MNAGHVRRLSTVEGIVTAFDYRSRVALARFGRALRLVAERDRVPCWPPDLDADAWKDWAHEHGCPALRLLLEAVHLECLEQFPSLRSPEAVAFSWFAEGVGVTCPDPAACAACCEHREAQP